MDYHHNIKLVIWDLDETLWSGTLSEGNVSLIDDFKLRVSLLNKRGILNSICSKNNFTQAKQQLEKFGIWDQFVYSSIDFSPKGQQIQSLLKAIGLRPENVLLIDDNKLNRQEVEYYNHGISTLAPEQWLGVCCDNWGQCDNTLSRMRTYQELERKHHKNVKFKGDNVEFLCSSNIRVTLVKFNPATCNVDRITELLNRSNQINFTKRRFPYGPSQLIFQLEEKASTAFVIYVTDNYVDYGLCGFVSISASNDLDDFSFSCRLLNMGVEKAVFQHLLIEYPQIQCWGQQVPHLIERADWVRIDVTSSASQNLVIESKKQIKALTVMGCIGHAIAPFLGPEFAVECSTSLTASRSVLEQHESIRANQIDFLILHAYNEVLFPTENIFFKKVTLPVMLNAATLANYPDILKHVESLLLNNKPFDFFGRTIGSNLSFKLLWQYSKSNLFQYMMSKLNADTIQSDINELVERLPNHTKVIMLSASTNDAIFTEEPWCQLNDFALSRLNTVNEIAREVAKTNNRFILFDPSKENITLERSGEHFGHYSHSTYACLGRRFKQLMLEL